MRVRKEEIGCAEHKIRVTSKRWEGKKISRKGEVKGRVDREREEERREV